jgi:toxin ParE1/3/4
MNRVLFRPEAEEDLLTIAVYVADFNANAAISLVQRLRKRCAVLKERAFLGRLRPELGDGIRCLVEKPYVLLYRVAEDVIEIVAVVHGARDLPAVLRARIERDAEADDA